MRDTIESIRDKMIEQRFIPRKGVYANSDFGKVDVVVYNIHGDMTDYDAGVPMVRFEATNKTNETKVFMNLGAALRFIGLYSA